MSRENYQEQLDRLHELLEEVSVDEIKGTLRQGIVLGRIIRMCSEYGITDANDHDTCDLEALAGLLELLEGKKNAKM